MASREGNANDASSGAQRQSVDELNFHVSLAARVVKVNGVSIDDPNGFEPHAARPLNPEVKSAVGRSSVERRFRESKLFLENIFSIAERLMDKGPQVIQIADGFEGLGHHETSRRWESARDATQTRIVERLWEFDEKRYRMLIGRSRQQSSVGNSTGNL